LLNYFLKVYKPPSAFVASSAPSTPLDFAPVTTNLPTWVALEHIVEF